MTNQIDKVTEKGIEQATFQAEREFERVTPKIIRQTIYKKGTIQNIFSIVRKFRQEKI